MSLTGTQTGICATATVIPPSPTPFGTTPQCGRYYQAQSGDSCQQISLNNKISVALFESTNPSINDDCTNIVPGYYYCIFPTETWNATANARTLKSSLSQETRGNEITRKEIKFSIAGVVDVVGYFITDTFEIGVELKALGIVGGNFYGSAKNSISLQLDLLLIGGIVRFYIEDGDLAGDPKQLRISYDLNSKVFATTLAKGDDKIFDL